MIDFVYNLINLIIWQNVRNTQLISDVTTANLH